MTTHSEEETSSGLLDYSTEAMMQRDKGMRARRSPVAG